jgi:hypothetical protein
MTSSEGPATVRALDGNAAADLVGLAEIFDELRTVLRCCERLVAELGRTDEGPDDLTLEALWTTTVLSYSRCFRAVDRKEALAEHDVSGTGLQGEVVEWHKMLLQIREHYADPGRNPRERFTVGATQDVDGRANGVAVTSVPLPRVDDVTVRQTGALAFHLSTLVDERITRQQQRVLDAATALSKAEMDRLPLIDVTAPEDSTPGETDG